MGVFVSSPKNINSFFSTNHIHYNEEAGITIYETLSQEKPVPQPQIINAQNIPQFIKWHKKMVNGWLLSYSSWKQTIDTLLPIKETISPVSISFNDLSHIETYKPNYREYKIYSIGELYLTVPLSLQPPFDVLKLIALNYPGMLKGYSLQDIINAIDRKNKSKAQVHHDAQTS